MGASGEVWAIVLAAGSGTRLARSVGGVKKQFLFWKGFPLFWHSALIFSKTPSISGIVFVFPPDEVDKMKVAVSELDKANSLGVPFKVTQGGERRQDSVFKGLDCLPARCSHILIHDSARPFASVPLVTRIIDTLKNGLCAVIPAVDVTDTIKEVDGNVVEKTLDRSRLKAVQTPQGFFLPILFDAHKRANEEGWDVTDDASLLEMCGENVHICAGEERNMKITNPEDIKRI